MGADGEDRARTCAEQRVVDAPLVEQLAELVQREALADSAEINLTARFQAANGWRVRMNREHAGKRRWHFLRFRLHVLDDGAKGDVEKSAGQRMRLECQQQALVAGFVEEKRFAALHAVDAPDIATVDETAEVRFEPVDLLEAFARHVACGTFIQPTKAQVESCVHRIVREIPGVVDGVRLVHRGSSCIQRCQISRLIKSITGTPARKPRGSI